MTTALAVLIERVGGIQPTEADLIFQEGLNFDDSFAFVPTQLTVAPGGVAAFATADGEMVPAPLSGVVIGSVIARGLWREGNKVPFCSSIGGDFGTVNATATPEDFGAIARFKATHPLLPLIDSGAPALERFPCRGCPMAEYDTDPKGKGKACKEKRRLLFLPDGWAAPVILNLPAMSVKPWDAYCSALGTKHRKPFYAVKTKFAIVKTENGQGQPYGVVTPAVDGYITDPALARAVIEVQRQFAEVLRTVPMEDGTYDRQAGDVDGYGAAGAGAGRSGAVEEEPPF